MDARFAAYNTHLYDPANYWNSDHHLLVLKTQPYIYESPLIHELPRNTPGIYTVGGGRQIGKTTLLKQWIALLMASGVPPNSILFLTGELIDDHYGLVELLREYSSTSVQYPISYVIVDEVTYIKGWDKGIKVAADAGYLTNIMVVLTGSDLVLMQEARMTFPGRRGRADKVDFHLYPLSFREVLGLKKTVQDLDSIIIESHKVDDPLLDILFQEFESYLRHGGYLTAINDIAREGKILLSTLSTYSDWIRGDMLKRDKQERYLKEILVAIIKHYNKQISWHTLSDALSIDSHKTVADYCELLASMDALFIQQVLLEDKLTAAPKKPKKIIFTDPFVYHAVKQWLFPINDSYDRIVSDCADPEISSELVEAVVVSLYRRCYPTYYIKAEGEVDVAYVDKEKFWPVEVKWRNQIRSKDLKQISKYKQARIFSETYTQGDINGIPVEPLPLAVLKIC